MTTANPLSTPSLKLVTWVLGTIFSTLSNISLANELATPLFYKIQYAKHTSYLLATVHYGVGLSDLPPLITSLHAQASMHVYESLGNTSKKATFDRIAKFEGKGKNLNKKSEMSDDDRDFVVRLGVPSIYARYMEYSDCHAIVFRKYWFSGDYKSVDGELGEITRKLGTDYLTLDTPELRNQADEVHNTIDEVPKCTVKLFVDNPSFIESSDENLERLLAKYRLGSEEIHRQFTLSNPDRGVELRNKEWMKTLEPLLKYKDNVFIAVGSGHFFGQNGLIPLLRKLGFTVQRVEY